MSDIWTELERSTPKEATVFLEAEPKQARIWTEDGSLIALENPTDGRYLTPQGSLVKRENYVEPLGTLKGTITLLRDYGLIDTEIVDRLLSVEGTLGETPPQALLTGKRKAVRWIAGALVLRR